MPPLPVERCLPGREVFEPRLVGGAIVHGVASEGAGHLEVVPLDGTASRLVPLDPPLRAARGLGGGSWAPTPDGGSVVYVAVDGGLAVASLAGGPVRRLTPTDRQVSGPVVAGDGRTVVHAVDEAEVWTVDLVSGSTVRLDRAEHDFCLDPHIGDGEVRWVGWRVPDMPWDHAEIAGSSIDGTPRPTLVPPGAVQQPRIAPDGTLLCLRDDTGWLNLWHGDRPLVDESFEHGGPLWGPGQRSYAISPDGRRVAFTRNELGFGRLCVVDTDTGRVDEVARGVHGQLDWRGDRLVAMRTGARTPTGVVVYDTADWSRRTLATGDEWPNDALVEPELLAVDHPDGHIVHARWYRADSDRLLVWVHGGPTDQWQVTFMPRIAYWRSRGWNVIVPDHRGSTGHGRVFQQSLRHRWGVDDVADVLEVTRAAHRRGIAVPPHTVLMGSSAGGFCALGALGAAPDMFAGAAVLYPVTDLVDLAERSHRFERHYTDTLVGPLPETATEYRRRSPVAHAERLAGRPLLVLHGEVDPVVPVDHSRAFVDRVIAAGGDATLHVYPGEGHGFRRREHQLDEYRRLEQFLTRCLQIASSR